LYRLFDGIDEVLGVSIGDIKANHTNFGLGQNFLQASKQASKQEGRETPV
jgi:hypothetical protein